MKSERSLALASVALLSLLACSASSHEDLGRGQQSLRGTVTYDDATCSPAHRELLDTASWYARAVTATDAFADCVTRVMQGDTIAGLAAGPYIQCNGDPVYGLPLNDQIADAIASARTANPVHIACAGGAFEAGVRAWSGDIVRGNPSAAEQMTFTSWFHGAAFAPIPLPQCIPGPVLDGKCRRDPYGRMVATLAQIIVHEVSHDQGHKHLETDTATNCSIPPGVSYNYQGNTIPYIVDKCVEHIIRRSHTHCGDYLFSCTSSASALRLVTAVDATTCDCFDDPRTTNKGGPPNRDYDRDGVPDYRDNCPTIPNADQRNSNWHAERELDVYPWSSDPDNGRVPTTSDSQAYKVHWHAQFRGDACDKNATTSAIFSEADEGTSTTCTRIDSSGPTTTSCTLKTNTAIDLDSWIGNIDGNAQESTGDSVPVFCHCDWVTPGTPPRDIPADCKFPPYNCVIADDAALPSTLGGSGSGFKTITRRDTPSSAAAPYGWIATTHRNRSDKAEELGKWTPSTVKTYWHFPSDRSAFLVSAPDDLPGVAWVNVNRSTFSPGTGVSLPAVNFPNHYAAHVAREHKPTIIGRITLIPKWLAEYIFYGRIDVDMVTRPPTPGWVSLTPYDGSVLIALQTGDTSAVKLDHLFTTGSTSVLEGLANGTTTMLVAEDAVVEGPLSDGTFASVVIDHDRRVEAAFVLSSGRLDAITAAQMPLPEGVTVLAGRTGVVWTIAPGGAELNAQPIAGLVSGDSSNDIHMAVTGEVPEHVIAMTWSPTAHALFALDAVPTLSDLERLRLLRIEEDGTSREVWHTGPFDGRTLHGGFLSPSSTGIVMTLNMADGNTNVLDIVNMDDSGRIVSSFTRLNEVALRRAIRIGGYFSVPVERTPAQCGYYTNLHQEVVPIADVSDGLGGTTFFESLCETCEPASVPEDDGDVMVCHVQ